MKTITISEGKTNALVLPAILILLIGIPFCIFLPLVGILILLFGVSLFYQHRNSRSTVKSITYDLYLEDEFGKNQMIYEFLAYKPAKEALNAFADIKQIEAIDHIAAKIQENRMKRGNR